MKIKQLHISKTIKLLFFSLFLISCTNQELATNDLKEGKYAWKEQSQLEAFYYSFLLNKGQVIGDSLSLFNNNNFTYTTCGDYFYGKYDVVGDSLYLNIDSSTTKSDDTMYYDKYTYTFFIKDETTLTRETEVKLTKNSKETHKVISILYYISESSNLE